MDDQPLVGEGNRRGDPLEQQEPCLQPQAPFADEAVERKAVDELHDEEGQSVLGAAAVVQAGDVGMDEFGQQGAFGGEAFGSTLAAWRVEHLDGHLLPEQGVVALRHVDAAHATTRQPGADRPHADPRADRKPLAVEAGHQRLQGAPPRG